MKKTFNVSQGIYSLAVDDGWGKISAPKLQRFTAADRYNKIGWDSSGRQEGTDRAQSSATVNSSELAAVVGNEPP